MRALDIASSRLQINATFAQIASSELIKGLAISKLQLQPSQQVGLSTNANVILGTNILNITATGNNPVVVRDFANAVGQITVNYVLNLYDVFALEPLDVASLPAAPIQPNLPVNLLFASILGLGIGIGATLLIEYLKVPYAEPYTFNIIDRETGAYSKSYLTLRLDQEMARSKRHKHPLSLGLIDIEFEGEDFPKNEQDDTLRQVKILAEKALREEDLIARYNGHTFAVLYPDTTNDQAQNFMQTISQKIGSVIHDVESDGRQVQMRNFTSVISYETGHMTEEHFLEKAVLALRAAKSDSSQNVL
jgi:diguanylate cyclase (GGDEF)-like protein